MAHEPKAKRPWGPVSGALLAVAVSGLALPSAGRDGLDPGLVRPATLNPSRIRAVVLERDEADAAALAAIRSLGANTVVTLNPPSLASGMAARAAGLSYIAFVTSADIERADGDPAFAESLRRIESLAGFYFWDDGVAEGYTAPAAQERAYAALKRMFPDKLVLYPTRLDPIQTDPSYLDSYFRPEFTDLVTPYFYPVGTTVLGVAQESDPWPERLSLLLSAISQRMPAGKRVLPVLQGFEQTGYPVSRRFPSSQMAVYRRVFPDCDNAAIFAWEIRVPGPLVELRDLPALAAGVFDLFASLALPEERRRRPPRLIPWR